ARRRGTATTGRRTPSRYHRRAGHRTGTGAVRSEHGRKSSAVFRSGREHIARGGAACRAYTHACALGTTRHHRHPRDLGFVMGKVTAVGMNVVTERSGHTLAPFAPSVCITPAAPAPVTVPYPVTGSSTEGIAGAPFRI